MKDNDIVAEVRRGRDAHAKRFNYDLDAIVKDIRKREALNKDRVVSLPPKRVKTKRAPGKGSRALA
jgi:hypothetical protein